MENKPSVYDGDRAAFGTRADHTLKFRWLSHGNKWGEWRIKNWKNPLTSRFNDTLNNLRELLGG